MARIKKGDLVKIISGGSKGTVGKVTELNTKDQTALVDGVGNRTRHVKPSQLNPRGGKRDIQVPVDLSKLALVVDEKSSKTSRVGYGTNQAGEKVRQARSLKNKEIK